MIPPTPSNPKVSQDRHIKRKIPITPEWWIPIHKTAFNLNTLFEVAMLQSVYYSIHGCKWKYMSNCFTQSQNTMRKKRIALLNKGYFHKVGMRYKMTKQEREKTELALLQYFQIGQLLMSGSALERF